MSQKHSMKIVKTALIALAVSLVSIAGVNWLAGIDGGVGTVVTTLTGSNNLSDFPTTYNANLAALNAGKMEISTTTLPLITTLSNLSTVGTITSGTWNGDAITAPYGGTGSTTLTSNYVLLGNGASGIKHVSGFGSSGQFLTSNGSGAAPTWQTSAINLGDNYAWTGLHTFASTTTFNANAAFTSTSTFTGEMLNDGFATPLTASTTITGATLPEAVYIATTTGAVLLSDANATSTVDFVGFAITSGNNGDTVYVQTNGIVGGFSGLTKGSTYYVQDTAGDIGTSIGTLEIIAGVAVSPTEIFMDVNRGMQYLGNVGGTNSVVVHDLARFAAVKMVVNGSCSSTHPNITAVTDANFFLAKYGNTVGTLRVRDGIDTGGVGVGSVTATWSGDTITFSESGGCSLAASTVYMYR